MIKKVMYITEASEMTTTSAAAVAVPASATVEGLAETMSGRTIGDLVDGLNEFGFIRRKTTRPWELRVTIDPLSPAKFPNGIEIKQVLLLGDGDATFVASPGGKWPIAYSIQKEEMAPLLDDCVRRQKCPCCPGALTLREQHTRLPFYGCTSYNPNFSLSKTFPMCVFKYYPASIKNLSMSLAEKVWKRIVSLPTPRVLAVGEFRVHVEALLKAYCPVENLLVLTSSLGLIWAAAEQTQVSLTVDSTTKLYNDVIAHLVTQSRDMPHNSPLVQKLWMNVVAFWEEKRDRIAAVEKIRKRKRAVSAGHSNDIDNYIEPTASIPGSAVKESEFDNCICILV
jgi:hypothetical protein